MVRPNGGFQQGQVRLVEDLSGTAPGQPPPSRTHSPPTLARPTVANLKEDTLVKSRPATDRVFRPIQDESSMICSLWRNRRTQNTEHKNENETKPAHNLGSFFLRPPGCALKPPCSRAPSNSFEPVRTGSNPKCQPRLLSSRLCAILSSPGLIRLIEPVRAPSNQFEPVRTQSAVGALRMLMGKAGPRPPHPQYQKTNSAGRLKTPGRVVLDEGTTMSAVILSPGSATKRSRWRAMPEAAATR
jgi:hypothetical protein